MTVFKTFLKVLKSCKSPIIMYTLFLVFFGVVNLQTASESTNFTKVKPDVFIVNKDQNQGITKNLIDYIEKNSNIVEIENNLEAIDDALFYRDASYVIYIPEGYRDQFLKKLNPEIQIKSTNDYEASLASMMLERYIKVANIYNDSEMDEEKIIKNINTTLEKEIKVELTSKLDTDSLTKATFFYNFANYCILAGCVYVICLILSSFRSINIRKRTLISSMNYKEYNRKLLLSNALFALGLWAIYVILSFVLLGDIMLSFHGLMYIINSLLFTICSLTLAFLIANLITNKNALNGIVNVVALGTSFLCGAFVPLEWLPDNIIKFDHLLPSYYYISSNEIVSTLEIINIDTLSPIIFNMIIVIAFSILFIIIANIISKFKTKIN